MKTKRITKIIFDNLKTLIGALIIAVNQFGIVFIDIKPFWQFVVVGIVIIVAVIVDQSKNKLKGERSDE